MNLFNKPINQITYEDVVTFCQLGIGEGVNLDYKEDFPKHLEKSISAFANTNGGMIIIGVKENPDCKPQPPFEGIDHIPKLEDRIWNIILDNIYPPVFPEIQICPPTQNKTFIVIRIPESNESPHAILNNTNVYLRTGNRNNPEELATIQKIEWLINRREKSERLRMTLYESAALRYSKIKQFKQIKIDVVESMLSFSPVYPHSPLFDICESDNIIDKIKTYPNIKNGKLIILPDDTSVLKPIPGGINQLIAGEFNRNVIFLSYVEINKFGLIFYTGRLGQFRTKVVISLRRIFDLLMKAITEISAFYKTIGYWGLIEIKFSLQNLLGVRIDYDLGLVEETPEGMMNNKTIEVDDQLSWQMVTSTPELIDPFKIQHKLLEMTHNIIWDLGFKITKDSIKEDLIRTKDWIEYKKTS